MPWKKTRPTPEKKKNPTKEVELSDAQAAQVTGGADSRKLVDCEGYSYLSSTLNSPNTTKVK